MLKTTEQKGASFHSLARMIWIGIRENEMILSCVKFFFDAGPLYAIEINWPKEANIGIFLFK